MSSDPDLIVRIHALTRPLVPKPTAAAPVLAPVEDIRAVLFDVYGTLVISASGDIGLSGQQADNGDTDPFRSALLAAGIDAATLTPETDGREELIEAIRVRHARARSRGTAFPEIDILEVWTDLLPRLGLGVSAADVRRMAVEYEFRVNAVWTMPDLDAQLAALRKRGVVLGIVSNAQFYTPLMLEAFLGAPIDGLGLDPACCAWSYRLGVAKPSRSIYREALSGLEARHGIKPAQVLYVGNDLRNDIWPAAAEGCRTVLFAGDARSLRLRADDPDLADVAPDRVVTELAQIDQALLGSAP
jgi:putative hydrolase of the HAD superfamily